MRMLSEGFVENGLADTLVPRQNLLMRRVLTGCGKTGNNEIVGISSGLRATRISSPAASSITPASSHLRINFSPAAFAVT
jgi:hypothetical protein